MVGVVGIEMAINEQCGKPPAKEPVSLMSTIGMRPCNIVRLKMWKEKFASITKEQYPQLVESLKVANKTTREGDWLVGSGLRPHMGGTEEAAIAINIITGKVFAAMMIDTGTFETFGFVSIQDAPPYLSNWLSKKKNLIQFQ
jgi:hypothetical protein